MNHFAGREEEWKLARVGKVLTRGGVRTRISGQASKRKVKQKAKKNLCSLFLISLYIHLCCIVNATARFGLIVIVL